MSPRQKSCGSSGADIIEHPADSRVYQCEGNEHLADSRVYQEWVCLISERALSRVYQGRLPHTIFERHFSETQRLKLRPQHSVDLPLANGF